MNPYTSLEGRRQFELAIKALYDNNIKNDKINKMEKITKVKYIGESKVEHRFDFTQNQIYDTVPHPSHNKAFRIANGTWYYTSDSPYFEDMFEIVSEAREFQIGDEVEIIANTNSSINKVGDIGIITELDKNEFSHRVTVEGRPNHSNYTKITDMRLTSKSLIPIIQPTDREIFESIKVEYYNNNFKITLLNKQRRTLSWVSPLRISDSNISCGIQELSNLNDAFGTRLRDFFDQNNLKDIYTEELKLDLIKKGLKAIFDNYKIGLLLMSTNIDRNEYFKQIASTIESFDNVIWTETHNRNSSNNIRLWSVDLYKHQNG